jgi:murein DD-endopeptidase MepM/ murein hydrolase activator NlpD
VSAHSYDARHRTSRDATTKSRRLRAGLALPTIAAAALTFTATGAAVATSPNTQPLTLTLSRNVTPVSAPLAAPVDHGQVRDQIRDRRVQVADDKAMAIVRADAAAKAARSTQRKNLAVRSLAAKRAEQALAAKRAERAHSWRLPINTYVLTSDFGWRWGRLHAGEDFAAPVGTDLLSMSTGTVTFAGQQSGYGNMVKIRYWDGTTSYYAHMSRTSVTEGEGVEPGEVVGQSGNTGHSTGPHLHLEIHPDDGAAVDPLPWMADHQIAP